MSYWRWTIVWTFWTIRPDKQCSVLLMGRRGRDSQTLSHLHNFILYRRFLASPSRTLCCKLITLIYSFLRCNEDQLAATLAVLGFLVHIYIYMITELLWKYLVSKCRCIYLPSEGCEAPEGGLLYTSDVGEQYFHSNDMVLWCIILLCACHKSFIGYILAQHGGSELIWITFICGLRGPARANSANDWFYPP